MSPQGHGIPASKLHMSAAGTAVLEPVGLDFKERIHEALVLSAVGDAQRIHVETKGTEVTLTGTVSSWGEFNQAGHAAWSVPSVTKVDNRLRVV